MQTPNYQGRSFGYVEIIVSHGDNGARRRVARFCCATCEAFIDVTRVGNGAVKAAENTGWRADQYRRERVRCPSCLRSNRKSDCMPTVEEAINTQKGPPISLTIADPTPDQRYQIRQKLDVCFDDKVGAFLDGMTDQKIGAMLGLPAILVTRIREAAYGPIRVDEAMLEFNRKIEAAEAKLDAAMKMVNEARIAINAARDDARKRGAA